MNHYDDKANYRITIEPLSDKAKEGTPETKTYDVRGYVLSATMSVDLETKLLLAQQGKQAEEATMLSFMGTGLVRAVHLLIGNLPTEIKAPLAAKILLERGGIKTDNTVAEIVIKKEEARPS